MIRKLSCHLRSILYHYSSNIQCKLITVLVFDIRTMVNLKSILGKLRFRYPEKFYVINPFLFFIWIAQATDPSLKEPDLGATFDFVEEIQRQKRGG